LFALFMVSLLRLRKGENRPTNMGNACRAPYCVPVADCLIRWRNKA
jgi:hypothetical protein